MRKKILLSILCICMVLTMMPTVGYAVTTEPPVGPVGDLYVNGVLIYSSDGVYNPTGVNQVSFNKKDSILTLNGATINNGACSANLVIAGIYSDFPLIINLLGNNSISITPQEKKSNYGIRTFDNLTIQGGGGALQ